MSHARRASKRRGRAKAVTVFGVAGALSLVGGASEPAVGAVGAIPTENTAPVITFGEEEISDVSLTTFYVFDNENAGAHRAGLLLAKRTRSRRGKVAEAAQQTAEAEVPHAAQAAQAAEGRMVCRR
jgi:hypothetical protein